RRSSSAFTRSNTNGSPRSASVNRRSSTPATRGVNSDDIRPLPIATSGPPLILRRIVRRPGKSRARSPIGQHGRFRAASGRHDSSDTVTGKGREVVEGKKSTQAALTRFKGAGILLLSYVTSEGRSVGLAETKSVAVSYWEGTQSGGGYQQRTDPH